MATWTTWSHVLRFWLNHFASAFIPYNSYLRNGLFCILQSQWATQYSISMTSFTILICAMLLNSGPQLAFNAILRHYSAVLQWDSECTLGNFAADLETFQLDLVIDPIWLFTDRARTLHDSHVPVSKLLDQSTPSMTAPPSPKHSRRQCSIHVAEKA